MGKAKVMSTIGFWAFIVGLVISVICGIILPLNYAIIIVLLIIGLIIGFLNITAKELVLFLVATIALIVVGNVFVSITTLDIGRILGGVLGYIATMMSTAAIVGAIKALWAVGRPGE